MSNNMTSMGRVAVRFLACAVLALPALQAHGAATIVIQNDNAAGEGFNDATPAVPVTQCMVVVPSAFLVATAMLMNLSPAW